jgi:hypothetical protein
MQVTEQKGNMTTSLPVKAKHEVTRRSIRVYMAGAIQGESLLHSLANIENGQAWTAKVFQVGFSPFPVFSDGTFIQKVRPVPPIIEVYDYSMSWLRCSDCLFLVPGYEKSVGCRQEIAEASKLGIPVFDALDDLCEWGDRQVIVSKGDDDYIEQVLGRSDD